jgi:hypothetical protein
MHKAGGSGGRAGDTANRPLHAPRWRSDDKAPICGTMALIRPSSFFRQVSPRGAIVDFVEVYRQAGTNRWRIAVAAAACTFATFGMMWQEEVRGPPRGPKITYITTWAGHRTDAEIIASNIANQRRKDWLAAEQAKRDAEVREIYKSLGRASGMDVDAMEKKAAADSAAAAAAAKQPSPVPAAPAPAR